MVKVVSWNKRVRSGESCQLEQKGMGWRKLSAGTKRYGVVKVVGWNKRVWGGESCQLEQNGMGW